MNLHGYIRSGLRDAKKILKESGLLLDVHAWGSQNWSSSKFSRNFLGISQDDNYKIVFETARNNLDYDFLLQDQSFLQFSYETDKDEQVTSIRYAYYEVPLNILSFDEFVQDISERENLDSIEWLPVLEELYSQAHDEASLKHEVMPMRYDYSPGLYDGIKHPASHFHIGNNNQIRIPCSYVLSPAGFVAFVVRHVYWNVWKEHVEHPEFLMTYLNCKPGMGYQLTSGLFNKQEMQDIFLA